MALFPGSCEYGQSAPPREAPALLCLTEVFPAPKKKRKKERKRRSVANQHRCPPLSLPFFPAISRSAGLAAVAPRCRPAIGRFVPPGLCSRDRTRLSELLLDPLRLPHREPVIDSPHRLLAGPGGPAAPSPQPGGGKAPRAAALRDGPGPRRPPLGQK